MRGIARYFPRTPLKNKNKNKKIYKYTPNVGKIPRNTSHLTKNILFLHSFLLYFRPFVSLKVGSRKRVGRQSLFCVGSKEEEERSSIIFYFFLLPTEKDGGLWTFNTKLF